MGKLKRVHLNTLPCDVSKSESELRFSPRFLNLKVFKCSIPSIDILSYTAISLKANAVHRHVFMPCTTEKNDCSVSVFWSCCILF